MGTSAESSRNKKHKTNQPPVGSSQRVPKKQKGSAVGANNINKIDPAWVKAIKTCLKGAEGNCLRLKSLRKRVLSTLESLPSPPPECSDRKARKALFTLALRKLE